MKTRPPKKKKTKYIPPHCIPKVVISAEEAEVNAADDEGTDLEANGTEPADVRNGTSVPSEPPANGIKTNGTAAAAAEGTEAEEISDLYAQRLPDIPRLQLRTKPAHRYLSLTKMFRIVGRFLGRHPVGFALFSILLALPSLGILKIHLKDRIRDGYTPENAPSRYETTVMREFWNASGDPIMTAVLLQARDGGSMLRLEYLREVVRLQEFLMHNFTLSHGGRKVRYSELCEPYCSANMLLEMFKEGLENEALLFYENEQPTQGTNLTFPVAYVEGFRLPLERSFFGVRLKENPVVNGTFTASNESGLPLESVVTNMEYVKVVMLLFRGDRSTSEKGLQLSAWELAVCDFSGEEYAQSIIDMQVIGTEVLDREMIRDGQRMTPYFAAGFLSMVIFVSFSVFAAALFQNQLDWGKVWIAATTTLCPLIAITTTYGLMSLIGLRVNSLLLILPFLVMGIGVDDGFLLMHAWFGTKHVGLPERLGLVLEEVGPSVTITTITNVVSFSIGAFLPTPEISLFCFGTALALTFVYVFQIILFCPVMALTASYESPDEKEKLPTSMKPEHTWRDTITEFLHRGLDLYCDLISNRIFAVFLLACVGVYWYFAILGTLIIETKIDAAKILPRDSPIQKSNHLLEKIVWAEYHPVTVLINREFDIRNVTQYEMLKNIVAEFESMERCKGQQSTLFWLRDYEAFFKDGDLWGDMLNLFFTPSKGGNATAPPPSPTGFDYSKLDAFLDSPFYEHWKGFMHVERDSKSAIPRVKRFWFNVAFHNTSGWEVRIDLMQRWREIASRYQELNVTVWEANSMFIDQMLSLKSVAVQTGLLTLSCMAVVCAIFIPNPCSVVIATISIASISMGVFGFLSWWHLDLDPVTLAAILMSIGLSVDFTAHVSYHFQRTSRREYRNGKLIKVPIIGRRQKLQYTLESVAWPMFQSGFSTVLCILPLVLVQKYAPIVFVKTIFLVASWGITHGLLVLPCFLSALPEYFTSGNFYAVYCTSAARQSYSVRLDSPRTPASQSELQALSITQKE